MAFAGQSRIVFAGGGSGGHLFPGIAIAQELQHRDENTQFVFVRSGRGIESNVLSDSRWPSYVIASPNSTQIRQPIRFVSEYWRSRREADAWLRREEVAVVIGLGGFASVPLVCAATRRGIPVLLLEVNTVPGRATRWLARKASTICMAFDECRVRSPARQITTGTPLRREILKMQPAESPNTILVLGGSQGARDLNLAMVEFAMQCPRVLLDGYRIIHQTGSHDEEQTIEAYRQVNVAATVMAFFDDMPELYASAAFAVTRAGAGTLAELACAGVPAVMLPYPRSVGNHQLCNAQWYERMGAGIVVHSLKADGLTSHLTRLVNDSAQLQPMRNSMRLAAQRNAAELVADEVERLIHTR